VTRISKLAGALASAALLSSCQSPPAKSGDGERVDPPALEQRRAEADAFKRSAHEDAFAAALPVVASALKAGDPFAAYVAGQGPAAIPPWAVGSRATVAHELDEAAAAVGEIDELYLSPASVVILRVSRFGLTRLHDDLARKPPLRQDPVAVLQVVDAVLDELHYRLLTDDCDAACESLPAALAAGLPDTRGQLTAASIAATRRAQAMTMAARQRCIELGARPLAGGLAAGLEQLAVALDDHHGWLAQLAEALAKATPSQDWTAKLGPIQAGHGPAAIERLPDILGPVALARRLSVEERVDLEPSLALTRTKDHIRRWEALRRELLGPGDPPGAGQVTPVDVERCTQALARIGAGLAGLPEVEAPKLDCERYVGLRGDRGLSEAALIVELLDHGVIEAQRRALRERELAELALVASPWSAQVHTHLRRIMLLARLDQPAALSLAIDGGQQALCLAAASLWIHAQIGPPSEVALAIGPHCAGLGDASTIAALVLGDARGALAGFGLSLIGDQPARMVGFDRFFWAPLGLMQILATPEGMHPDSFTLPDDPDFNAAPKPAAPELVVEVEQL